MKHAIDIARILFEPNEKFRGFIQERNSQGKNKISLRSLSMLARQEKYNSFKEKAELVKKGLRLAKEAVQLDPHDGTSWAILGNAHLSSFFCCQQNPMTLKQCLSAYAQAVNPLTFSLFH